MPEITEIRRANLRAEAERFHGQQQLANAIQKDKNQVWQWITTSKRGRNISNTMAREIEPKLGRPRGWLDEDHSDQSSERLLERGIVPVDSRSKNNMRALRFAVQSLFSVLHERMQDVAEDVAEDIVATAGSEFSGQGLLNTLVGILRGVEQTSEGAVPSPPQPPVSSASKRANQRTK
jgi:hypothetical protein